ncbi:hypothetical protein [Thalassospira lucentensis]|uniref:hypothetical protein n=1 Tax=Thalassospira lucentensis TaxID=168935 RepID=UPI003AA92DC6
MTNISTDSENKSWKRTSRAVCVISEGFPPQYLQGARKFVRDAPKKMQNNIIMLLHAGCLEHLFQRMETPDFFTKHSVWVLCMFGWNPYRNSDPFPSKRKATPPSDDEGLAVERRRTKSSLELGD